MPKQVDIKVVVGERGGGLKRGDYIVYGSRSGHVSHVEEKVKWAFVNTQEGERFKVPLDTEVLVTREEPTEEERASDRMADFTRRHMRSIQMSRKNVADMLKSIHKYGTEQFLAGHPMPVSIDSMLSLAAAQADWYWWSQVEDRMANYMDHHSIVKDKALLWAVADILPMARDYLLYKYNHRVLSRSTSVASNLTDDLKREAAANLLDDFRYDHLDDLMEQYPNTVNPSKEK